MNVKGVLFDFGGTIALGDLNKEEFRSRLYQYIRSQGFNGTEAQLRKAMRGMFEKLMKARGQNREIRLEDLYQGTFFELGLHPERAPLDYIHELYISSFNVELVYGVKEVLEYLSERYNLAIVSNSMSNVARHAMKKYNLEKYFDKIVISRDLGIRKPDPEIFKFTLINLGIKSYEAVHVGDSLKDDVQGAKSAGIKTIWIKNAYEDASIQPDYTINSIKELTSLL